MFKALIRKAPASFVVFGIVALTAGTVLAQEGEGAPGATGLTLAVLVLGLSAIALIFFISWSRSIPDDNDS